MAKEFEDEAFEDDADDDSEALEIDDDLEIEVLDGDDDDDEEDDDLVADVAIDDDEDEDEELDEELADDEVDADAEEESLDVLLARDVDEDLVRLDDEPRDGLATAPATIGEDEFTCQSCFLVKRRAQLADPKKMYCVDCA